MRAISGIDPDGGEPAGKVQDPIRDARQITQSEREEIAQTAQKRGKPDAERSKRENGPGNVAAALVDDGMVESCHMAVLHALALAGKRLLNDSTSQGGPGRTLDYPTREKFRANPYGLHMHVPVGDRDVDRLLDGAWSALLVAREDGPVLVPVVDHYVRLLLAHRVEHTRDYLRTALLQSKLGELKEPADV